ncbi:MAG: ThiJ/PfpI family protein [Pseudonocardia sp.]|nr:ThiJ/PfpI family protein [Pseudonocardia sp.]
MTTQHTPNRALLVLTDDVVLEGTGDSVHDGTDPWLAFTTGGWTVDVTSIHEDRPRDPGDDSQPSRTAQATDPKIPNPNGALKTDEVNPADHDNADYDIVCFVEGHGAMWGSPRNHDLSRLVAGVSEYGRIIAVVCPAALGMLELFSPQGRKS